MAKADLQRLSDELEKKLYANSEEYRNLTSDYKVHSFRISEQDLIKQVKTELKMRQGGFGENLPPSIEEIIEREVPLMCQTLFRLFDPSRAVYKRTTTKVTPTKRIGSTSKKFIFVLAAKPGEDKSVFDAFRKRKQAAQKPLVKALDEEIQRLNKESSDSPYVGLFRKDERTSRKTGRKYTVNVVDNFLDIGHEDKSAVFLQRGREAEAALLQFSAASDAAQSFISELLQDFNVVLTPEKGKRGTIRTVRATLQSKWFNRKQAKIEKEQNEKIEEILAKLASQIEWEKEESSDSPIQVIEKRMLNNLLLIVNDNKSTRKANFKKQKIKDPVKKPVKSKSRRAKASIAPSVKDNKRVIVGGSSGRQRNQESQVSINVLLGLLNRDLNKVVQRNMGFPALENRTGRFAGSVRAVDVTMTPKGFPSIGYTYERSPYGVYESSSGTRFSNAERDPRKLIDASIREIAAQYMQTRIFTRRV